MSNEFSRTDRISAMILRSLTKIIQHEVKDPRLSNWITLSDMNISKDLRNAKVYFTVFKDDPVIAESVLNSAAGYIRKLLAKTLNLRVVPVLRFVYDDSVAYGSHLSNLIDDVNVPDKDDDSC